jgi:hypothetical protein
MVDDELAATAANSLVRALVTDWLEGVRARVARLFGHGVPDPATERLLDAALDQLADAAKTELAQVQADLAEQWRNHLAKLLADHPQAEPRLAALVEDLKPVIASAGATPQAIPGSAWQAEMQNFIVGRYDRVQAAAQTWLTIMTTLFGVFSAVVVVGGARTISEIHGGLPWRIGAVAGAAAVYVLAFAATIYGLFASWGGLRADLQREEEKSVWRELKDMWSPKKLELAEIKDPHWPDYRRKYALDRANKNRKRLHRSRILGVTAVAFAGLLGFALIANGFIG